MEVSASFSWSINKQHAVQALWTTSKFDQFTYQLHCKAESAFFSGHSRSTARVIVNNTFFFFFFRVQYDMTHLKVCPCPFPYLSG